MADASEDTLHNPADDADPTDEVVDFRFLTAQKLPSRGIKDFEPHGTKLQQSTLDASRQAMYDVLSVTRTHSQHAQRAVWDSQSGGAWVTKPGGKWATSVGQSKRTANNGSRLWLLPEEALWLIDRGSLDIRWPAGPGEEPDDGIPMSLQGAYAAFVRLEQSYPLTLEMYSVYAYLKRAGYIVLRADANQHNVPKSEAIAASKFWPGFRQLWNKIFAMSDRSRQAKFGPLIRPGIYRDYAAIFNLLTLIPFSNPRLTPDASHASHASQTPADERMDITFHVYKPDSSYKKTQPGPPDFYISVVDAASSNIPSEPDLNALLLQTPYHAPTEKKSIYPKLKHGYRNVILAVVDQGVTSFLNVSDAGFGCERLWMDKNRSTGGKLKGGRRSVPPPVQDKKPR